MISSFLVFRGQTHTTPTDTRKDRTRNNTLRRRFANMQGNNIIRPPDNN